ncbi:unnamed protein product [Meganyctiphanes norvegica]|uniref:C-type lectin domain-containing protein n=1 Tax=Meganyctiphanes norvegica TaxID=48144 RepID=A0AAV2QT62_MEGNR
MSLVGFLFVLFLGVRSSGSEEFVGQVSQMSKVLHIHKTEDPSCKVTAKHIEDQLNKLELLASTIQDDVRDIKHGPTTARDLKQNLDQEITASITSHHDMYMLEVSFPTSGGIAKASSSHETTPPMNAFISSGYWHSRSPYTVPQSLWFEFTEPIRVVKYSFTSNDEERYIATDGPSKYIFWASNHSDCSEESLWVILKEDNSGIPFKISNAPKVEYINNSQFYRCYGFKVTDVPGRSPGGIKPVTIGNIRFYSILGDIYYPEQNQLSYLEQLLENGNKILRETQHIFQTLNDSLANLNSAAEFIKEGSASDSNRLLVTPDMSQKLTWYESWMRCQEMGAESFIPRTKSDFSILKTVRFALDDYFWIPASDFAVENHLRWYNGEEASNTPGLEWTEGTHQALNEEEKDCVVFGSRLDGVFMWNCNNRHYPMICKKNI